MRGPGQRAGLPPALRRIREDWALSRAEGCRAGWSGPLRQDRGRARIGTWAAAFKAGGPCACLPLGHVCLVGTWPGAEHSLVTVWRAQLSGVGTLLSYPSSGVIFTLKELPGFSPWSLL